MEHDVCHAVQHPASYLPQTTFHSSAPTFRPLPPPQAPEPAIRPWADTRANMSEMHAALPPQTNTCTPPPFLFRQDQRCCLPNARYVSISGAEAHSRRVSTLPLPSPPSRLFLHEFRLQSVPNRLDSHHEHSPAFYGPMSREAYTCYCGTAYLDLAGPDRRCPVSTGTSMIG